jgi:serine/threonine protein kinase
MSESPAPENGPKRQTNPLPSHAQERIARRHGYEEVSSFRAGDPLPGAKYWTLVEFIGRGSFGEVWRATHEWNPEIGAVKFCVYPHARELLAGHEKKMIVRAMREAKGHPNIVPLWECNLDVDPPWLLYEFVPGGRTLSDVIVEGRDYSVKDRVTQTVRLLSIVAKALIPFHRHDPPLVHRDLKPDNIIMAGEIPRITDFGISGAAVEATTDSTSPPHGDSLRLPSIMRGFGNNRFAAPEQLAKSAPDPRNDVFTLGVVAYQMMTGDLASSPGADVGDELRELGVPDNLASLIVKSVSKKFDRRPKDASEWVDALTGAANVVQSRSSPNLAEQMGSDDAIGALGPNGQIFTDPLALLAELHPARTMGSVRPQTRKSRMYLLACARRQWRRLPDVGRAIVALGEVYADTPRKKDWLLTTVGAITERLMNSDGTPGDLIEAQTELMLVLRERGDAPSDILAQLERAARSAHPAESTEPIPPDEWRGLTALLSLPFESHTPPFHRVPRQLHSLRLLREVYGLPYQLNQFASSWRTEAVMQLAAGMYESRDFTAMPCLADALEDAECDDLDILEHCRDTSLVHVRGCWVLDLVLGMR